MKKEIIFVFLSLFSVQNIYSQIVSEKEANQLFIDKKYSTAQSIYQQLINQEESNSAISYHLAKCSKELFLSDAIFLYNKHLEDYPSSPFKNQVYEDMALIYFRSKQYSDAIFFLNKLDRLYMSSDLMFKLAYANFSIDSIEEASYHFSKLKIKESKYKEASEYYYAYISYKNKQYNTALLSFMKLLDSKKFSSIVPYYIAQIYYEQKKYKALISFVKPFIDDVIPGRISEMNRLMAESYYFTSDYNNAIKYFNYFLANVQNPSSFNYFLLAYSYYQVEDYNRAIHYFEQVSTKSDSLSQFSAYYLGTSYIKSDNLNYALQAFKKASTINYNEELQEEAYFNYAKLAYQLDLPFENTLAILNSYFEMFPRLLYQKDIEVLIVQILQGSSKYKEAYDALSKINVLSFNQKYVLQSISYFLGVEAYNSQEYNKAISYFKEGNKVSVNKNIDYLINFWLADCYYQNRDIVTSIELYSKLEVYENNKLSYYKKLRNYNLAYCYFQQEEYLLANKYFRIYEEMTDDSLYLNDVCLRIADSYFMNSNYLLAQKYYNKAVKYKLFDTDYALYNRSLSLGLLSRDKEMVVLLKELINNYSNSVYYDNALFHLANYYKNLPDYDKSIMYYSKVLESSDRKDLLAGSRLNKGVVYLNNNSLDNAIIEFLFVVDSFPKTGYFKEAVSGLQSAYTSMGQIDKYFSIIENLPSVNISNLEQDSLVYNTGFIKFSEEDYASSFMIFNKYIKNFPNGVFLNNARYYIALSSLELQDTTSAVLYYTLIAESENKEYKEDALIFLARRYYDNKNFELSNKYYTALYDLVSSNSLYREAVIRLMYGNENIDLSLAFQYANKVLKLDKKDNWLIAKANIILARYEYENGNYVKARDLFKTVINFSDYDDGAEAKYFLAYLTFLDDSLIIAENMIFELAENYSNDYFIAKSFILLSDIYVLQSNIFQARATLESIINNYDGSDLIKIAKDKINLLKEEVVEDFHNELQPYFDIQEEDVDYFFDHDTTYMIDENYRVIMPDTLNFIKEDTIYEDK